MTKENQGFASMDPKKLQELARKGGQVAHQKGKAHEWTKKEAREAGRKGGTTTGRRKRSRADPETIWQDLGRPPDDGDRPRPSDDRGGRPDDFK